jgi:hypothetical protein
MMAIRFIRCEEMQCPFHDGMASGHSTVSQISVNSALLNDFGCEIIFQRMLSVSKV